MYLLFRSVSSPRPSAFSSPNSLTKRASEAKLYRDMADNGAASIVDQLIREGTRVVFGLPGTQIMALIDAFYDRRLELRFIHSRHEQGAAFMGYGYAKACGRPGVVVVVPGPGLLNASAAIGTAYAANAPVVVISGQIPRSAIGKGQGRLHEIVDQLECVRPITKWIQRVLSPKDARRTVQEALSQAQTDRPGPVVFDVPPEVLQEISKTPAKTPIKRSPRSGNETALKRAIEILKRAKRVAIVAGGGIASADAGQEVMDMAERLDAPVLITQNAKGALPESDPRVVGVTYYEGIGPAYKILPTSDVILGVGSRLFIRGLKLRPKQKVIQISADSANLGKNYKTDVAIWADAKTCLQQMLSKLPPNNRGKQREQEISTFRSDFEKEVLNLMPPEPRHIIDTLQRVLDRNAILVRGMNTVSYWCDLAYRANGPRGYITPGYFGTLGYELPTAIGAKVACPDRQVVCLCGDGGFLFAAEELATAVAQHINIVTILFNNRLYGASSQEQKRLFGGRLFATELHNPDFSKFVESFGAIALRSDLDHFEEQLRKALSCDKPSVLEVEFPNVIAPFHFAQKAK